MLVPLKTFLERVLVSSGLPRLLRRRRAGRRLVLAYHNVVPDDETGVGDASLHLPRSEFARQLDWLMETHEVVKLEELLEGNFGSHCRPVAALTFDDAYHGAVTVGVEELAARQLPATVFVSPGRLGGEVFWWDWVAENSGGSVPPRLRERALWEWKGCDPLVRGHLGSPGTRFTSVSLPPSVAACTEDDLLRASAHNLLSFGAHGWDHSNLAALSGDPLVQQLVAPLEWLRDTLEHVVPALAYPYGLNRADLASMAARAGYRWAFRAGGGWVSEPVRDAFALPRLNVPAGVSLEGFQLRASGLLR